MIDFLTNNTKILSTANKWVHLDLFRCNLRVSSFCFANKSINASMQIAISVKMFLQHSHMFLCIAGVNLKWWGLVWETTLNSKKWLILYIQINQINNILDKMFESNEIFVLAENKGLVDIKMHNIYMEFNDRRKASTWKHNTQVHSTEYWRDFIQVNYQNILCFPPTNRLWI